MKTIFLATNEVEEAVVIAIDTEEANLLLGGKTTWEYERLGSANTQPSDVVSRTWKSAGYVDVVFDGPPGHVSGRFVEVENEEGKSVRVGEWIERPNGLFALRFRGVAPENYQVNQHSFTKGT